MSIRDYIDEMNAYVLGHEPTGDVVLAQHAETLVKQLERDDPDLLDGWLHTQAQALVHEMVRARWRTQRNHHQQQRGAFDTALHSGDVSLFAQSRLYLPTKQVWRVLGDMTGTDHQDVADGYRAAEKQSRLLAAFHEAVARKVGRRQTRNVFTEQQYEAMMREMLA